MNLIEHNEILRPMKEIEFEKWSKISQEDYIKDLMENFAYSENKAKVEAIKEVQNLLPEGINTPLQSFYTYEKDGKDIGYIWFSTKESAVFLLDIIILPEYQSLGFGTTMMKKLIEMLSLSDIKEIELRVSPNNERAKRLYDTLGFKITGLDMHLAL